MNENSKEPVVEQALDNIESNVSEKKNGDKIAFDI